MFTEINLSIIANVCTIISSFSIVYAVYYYCVDKINGKKRLDFSNVSKRTTFFKLIAKDLTMISKVEIKSKSLKNKDLIYILSNRNMLAAKRQREVNLQNALSFILSDESISLLSISFPYVLMSLDRVLNRYCELALDGASFYNSDVKSVDAWVQLPEKGQFVVKFPIPNNLYNEETFNNSRWSGNGSIAGLGEEIIIDYFFPYLISYVSRKLDNVTDSDVAMLLLPYAWEFGPS